MDKMMPQIVLGALVLRRGSAPAGRALAAKSVLGRAAFPNRRVQLRAGGGRLRTGPDPADQLSTDPDRDRLHAAAEPDLVPALQAGVSAGKPVALTANRAKVSFNDLTRRTMETMRP